MTGKTIMKRAGIIALSAVVLQGITIINGNVARVEASENTGASYTALDLYTYLQDSVSTKYTLTDKAETFLEEHDDFFPASADTIIPDELIDPDLDLKHINKNPSRYGDKLMKIPETYVVQIQEEEMEEGHYLTWLNLSDGGEQQYSVYYNGELDDIFEDDIVEVTGLPLGTSSFENTSGGETLVIVLAGCSVNNINEDVIG